VLTVAVVNLDVHVTDRQGNPVRGLSRDDFEVLENGEPREVLHLVQVDHLGVPHSSSPQALPHTTPGLARDGGTPLRLVLHLDQVGLHPLRRARLLDALERWLEELDQPRLELAISIHDPPLRVLQSFTNEHERVLAKLRLLSPPPAASARAHLDREHAAAVIGGGRARVEAARLNEPCPNVETKLAEAMSYRVEARRRARESLDGLEALASMLGGVPGRKVVLYLGEGFEVQPALEMFTRLGNECPEYTAQASSLAHERPLGNALRLLTARANANRVTFFALDAAGTHDDADFLDAQLRQARVGNVQESLIVLAQETGGEALLNLQQPLPQLEALPARLASYYSLGYRAASPDSPELRAIQVRLRDPVARRSLSVRHQRSFRPTTLSQELAEALLAALWLGYEENPLEIEARAETAACPRPRALDECTLPIHIRVPLRSLSMPPGEVGRGTALRLFLMARDERGRRTPAREHRIEAGDQAWHRADASGAVDTVVEMSLPPGRYTVAAGVREEETSRTSVLKLTAVVP
jgi:VWFA-related protein